MRKRTKTLHWRGAGKGKNMAIPKKLLTASALKRQRELGKLDADTLAWYGKQVRNETARKRRVKAKKRKHRLHSQPITGDPALITVTPAKGSQAYNAFKKFQKKVKAAKLANEPVKESMETRKLLEAGAEIRQRVSQPRQKRRSPRTGLARFGITL